MANDPSKELPHSGKGAKRNENWHFVLEPYPRVAFTLESFEKDAGLIGSFQVFTPQNKI